MHREGECLEVDEIRKEIDDEFSLDIRNECFHESAEIEKELENDERK